MQIGFIGESAAGDPSRSARAFRVHRLLMRIAFAGGNLFAWIFIFQYFNFAGLGSAYALARVALLYALSQIITSLAVPYAARLLRHGVRRSLVMAAFAAALAFVALALSFAGLWTGAYFSLGLIGFAILSALYRALYWIPYHVEASVAGLGKRPGVLSEVLITLVPLLVGFSLAADPAMPVWLLLLAGTVIVLSTIPLSRISERYEGFSWGYRETFGQLLDLAHWDMVRCSFFDGVFGAALLLLWPIAVFLIVGRSYGMLGIVLSLTLLCTLLIRGPLRRILRRRDLRESPFLDAVLTISPWILRLVVAMPLGVVLVDTYFHVTTPRHLGIDPATFEQATDGGSFIDEYTALKEIALALGRATMCILAAVLALCVSLPVAFFLVFLAAAVASAFSIRSR